MRSHNIPLTNLTLCKQHHRKMISAMRSFLETLSLFVNTIGKFQRS